jgi:hypothetical protein
MRALGVAYPTTDWHSAWLAVLTLFLGGLGGVRSAIQNGEPQSASADSASPRPSRRDLA